MIGFFIALLSGALMSVQGVFNTQVTKTTGMWVSNAWVQLTAFAVCIAAWLIAGRDNVMTLTKVEPRYVLLGGVIGAVGGSYLYPYVIIKAYQILYIGLPEPVMLIHADQAVIAILIAVFCTVAATALSCYKELAGVPAELMRPEAPKQGKRVLLERVGFFWKHLSFTWKSSLR